MLTKMRAGSSLILQTYYLVTEPIIVLVVKWAEHQHSLNQMHLLELKLVAVETDY
jgi:hypothetical protein